MNVNNGVKGLSDGSAAMAPSVIEWEAISSVAHFKAAIKKRSHRMMPLEYHMGAGLWKSISTEQNRRLSFLLDILSKEHGFMKSVCPFCRQQPSDSANARRNSRACKRCQMVVDDFVRTAWRKSPHPNASQLSQLEPYVEEEDTA